MKIKLTVGHLALAFLAVTTILAMQNCAAPLESSATLQQASNGKPPGPAPAPAPLPLPVGPSMSMSTVSLKPGETKVAHLNLVNIKSSYSIHWQILNPGTTNFMATSGDLDIVSGATGADISIASIAALGSGSKTFQLQISENTSTMSAITVDLSVLDPGMAPSLSAGFASTCATIDGLAKCWGYNGFGELGQGDFTQRTAAATVLPALAGLVQKVDHGGDTTCAISGGKLYCWGSNSNGQLGDGSQTNNPTPIVVLGLESGVTDVSVGAAGNSNGGGGGHACAIKAGALFCWGRNDNGQLGLGDTAGRLAATAVPSLAAGVTKVAAGNFSTCAIQNGALKCWGFNGSGQLGDGTNSNRNTPTDVAGMASGVTDVSVGTQHVCAIQNGSARCWGLNSSGQLGDGTNVNKAASTQVSGLTTNVTQIVAGDAHSCALVAGAVKCWGANNNFNIGDGTSNGQLVATQVTGLTVGVSLISTAAQASHTCAIKAKQIFCWGRGANGQLGNGATAAASTPVGPLAF